MVLSFVAAGLLISAPQHRNPAASTSLAAETSRGETEVVLPVASLQEALRPIHTSNQARLVVNLSDREVHLYIKDERQGSYPLAVGQAGWETPTGTFRVTNLQADPVWQHPITGEVVAAGPNNPLGSHWIGFWSDEDTQVGFHGTNQADLIGSAVSHGCLRMHNEDIQEIFERVEIGTPVEVRS